MKRSSRARRAFHAFAPRVWNGQLILAASIGLLCVVTDRARGADETTTVLSRLPWQPATAEQVQAIAGSLRRLEDPFAASIRRDVARYRATDADGATAAVALPCEQAIVDALLGDAVKRNAAATAFEATKRSDARGAPTYEAFDFEFASAHGTTLVTGGPDGSTERMEILSTDAFQLSIDDRNKQLNWMLPTVLYIPIGLDRLVWPLPITAEGCATYRERYTWDMAPLAERDVWLVRLVKVDREGLELYLRVHGADCFLPQGALLVRDGVLQKAGFVTWACEEAGSAAIVPRSYVGFMRAGGATTLERWTMRNARTEFRPDDIRLELPQDLVLWDLRSQVQHRLGPDPSLWPADIRKRVQSSATPR